MAEKPPKKKACGIEKVSPKGVTYRLSAT